MVDEEGNKVSGVLIFVKNHPQVSDVSDKEGKFSLKISKPDIYTLIGFKKSLAGVLHVNMRSGKRDFSLVLKPGSMIFGNVAMENKDDLLKNVLIYLSGTNFYAKPDKNGNFKLTPLPPGCYKPVILYLNKKTELSKVCIADEGVSKSIKEEKVVLKQESECLKDEDCGSGMECVNGNCVYKEGFEEEKCDGIDNNGDGETDEGLTIPCFNENCEGGFKLCINEKMSDNCFLMGDISGEKCGDVCCPSGFLCVNGECKDCIPDCEGKECGSDGCGGSCGSCPEGKYCYNKKCCNGWKKNFKIWHSSFASSPQVVSLPNNEYLVAVNEEDISSLLSYSYLMKINKNNKIEWIKSFVVEFLDPLLIKLNKDALFVLPRTIFSGDMMEAFADYFPDYLYIEKISPTDGVVWKKGVPVLHYPPISDFIIRSFHAAKTPEGNIVIAGDFWASYKLENFIFEIDKNGELLWKKIIQFPFKKYHETYGVAVFKNGDIFLLTGRLNSYYYTFLNFDDNGKLLKVRQFNVYEKDSYYFNSVERTEDNGLLIVGELWQNAKTNGLLMKLNNELKIEWTKVFPDQKPIYGSFRFIKKLNNSEFAIAGNKYLFNDAKCSPSLPADYKYTKLQMWFLKIDNEGNILKEKIFEPTCEAALITSFSITDDGRFLVGLQLFNDIDPIADYNFTVMKLDKDFNLCSE